MAVKRLRLAERRKTMGFSHEQLAERLDIDRSTVSRWESRLSRDISKLLRKVVTLNAPRRA